MPSPLQDLIVPESKEFIWVEHAGELTLGPFTFPAAVPIPVAASENRLAKLSWMQVPMEGRLFSAFEQEDEGDLTVDGTELLRAFLEGHLSLHSPDAERLVDQVGRCLLIHATFGGDLEWSGEVGDVFSRLKKGAELFDLLIARARNRIQQGAFHTEAGDGDQALYEYLIARLMLHGAHLISPTTPGILYDLGVLTHDLAHSLAFEVEAESSYWREGLSRESQHYLQLSLGDEEIRETTPAFYLLGVNRETLGELQQAESAYRKFLASKAAERYPHLRQEVEQRRRVLSRDSSQD